MHQLLHDTRVLQEYPMPVTSKVYQTWLQQIHHRQTHHHQAYSSLPTLSNFHIHTFSNYFSFIITSIYYLLINFLMYCFLYSYEHLAFTNNFIVLVSLYSTNFTLIVVIFTNLIECISLILVFDRDFLILF
jgi:hypothetical protein